MTMTGESLPGPVRVGHGLSSRVRLGFFGGSKVFRRVSAQRRSSMAAHGLHAMSLATASPNAGLDVGFCFRVFMFFLMCSQFSPVMLKCYWTICWRKYYICHILFVKCALL
jgi:hypothetical protein